MSGENGLAASHILRTVNDWTKVRKSRKIFLQIIILIFQGKTFTTSFYA
jgi:hypothetical protein